MSILKLELSILKKSQNLYPRRKTLARVLLVQTQALGILNTVMQKKLNTLQLEMVFEKVQKRKNLCIDISSGVRIVYRHLQLVQN